MSTYSPTLIRFISKLNIEDKLLDQLNGQGVFAAEAASISEKLDNHSKRLLSMTKLHLEFIIKYGKGAYDVRDEQGRTQPDFSEYFYAWQVAGCPGVSPTTLERIIMCHLKALPRKAKGEPFRSWIDIKGLLYPKDC